LAIDDFLFAAWFLWMTPAETALSSLRLAVVPRCVGVAGLRSLAKAADRGLERGLDGLVALACLFVLPVSLDLGLDVCH
jgi:hypothetical protein